MLTGYEQFVEPIKRRKVFEDDLWCIYKWDDRKDYMWNCRFTMWHKCGTSRSGDHAIRKARHELNVRATKYMCVRCDVPAPDGLVGLYEMLNWKEQGYGG